MTALLTRIIPCQITQWVKPHPFVLLKICTGVYGFIGAERDDTNIFSFSMNKRFFFFHLKCRAADDSIGPTGPTPTGFWCVGIWLLLWLV